MKKAGGGGARGGKAGVRVLSRDRGTFNSTEGESPCREEGEGMVGKGKAKVYESKGTPNYSYTIHD